MANQSTINTAKENQLLEQLPELLERFQSILDLADPVNGLIANADEVEALLQAEIRRLGKTTMASWGTQREQEVGQQFKDQHPDARHGKKND